MLKLLQEIRGFAEMTRRRPPARSPGLLLMQMRAHVIQAALPKRRLIVRTALKELSNEPRPVKITHVHAPADADAVRPLL